MHFIAIPEREELPKKERKTFMTISIQSNSPLFKREFCFGTATAAYQIEGGIEHRLECIWDRFCSVKGNISDKSNGAVACDHFHRWREDLMLLKSLGVDAYRFSISWPRVINENGGLRQEGVDFYLGILDWLNLNGIKPFVTLYHWDLPQYLEGEGGWLNRETAYRFKDYVDKISRVFGDRVYSYATLNEPFCSAYLGYETGVHAPGIVGAKSGKQAGHHLLLAHGLGMQVLQSNSPNSLNGIVLNITPAYSASSSAKDIQASKLADEMLNQWFFCPTLTGEYPETFNALPHDVFPDIQENDMALISQPNDYIGINYYTREVYKATEDGRYQSVSSKNDVVTEMGWEIFPQGLTDVLVNLHREYSMPPIFITENGAAMKDNIIDGEIDDRERTAYLEAHLLAVEAAMKQGVDVRGYFAWSLLDNFEWAEGFTKRFGIIHVDYETQKRSFKNSARAYQGMLFSRG